jgi:putative acetyltransferase
MTATLRPPHSTERKALVELWVAAWKATYPEIDFEARRAWFVEHLAQLEAQGAKLVCALDEHAMLGFVTIDPATGWLDQIAVAPSAFGGGCAKALIEEAKRLSPARVTLDVNADNFRALRFYLREGFLKTGEGANAMSGRRTIALEWRPRGP